MTSVILGKNAACNYCIEKTSRVIFGGKNVACNYCIEKTSRVILKKKTASVILKEKNDECNGKKNGECLQSWPFSAIVVLRLLWFQKCSRFMRSIKTFLRITLVIDFKNSRQPLL